MRIRDWSSDVCSSDLLVAEFPVENLGKIGVRASAMTQRHRQLFGTSAETDKQHTFFAETSIAGESGPKHWSGGAARKSVVEGKGVDERVEHGGRRNIINQNTGRNTQNIMIYKR